MATKWSKETLFCPMNLNFVSRGWTRHNNSGSTTSQQFKSLSEIITLPFASISVFICFYSYVKFNQALSWMFKYVMDNFQCTFSAAASKCAFPHLRSSKIQPEVGHQWAPQSKASVFQMYQSQAQQYSLEWLSQCSKFNALTEPHQQFKICSSVLQEVLHLCSSVISLSHLFYHCTLSQMHQICSLSLLGLCG